MDRSYLVFSAGWEIQVEAESYEDAVSIGTKRKYEEYGQLFNISKTVVVVKAKGDLRSFDSIAVLEDLGLYFLAKQVRIYIKNRS
jgi:hypothetical protein